MIQNRFFITALMFLSLFSGAVNASQVFVGIPPYAGILKRLGKDIFTVKTLLPEGSSPATYTPSIRNLMEVKNSRVYVSSGVPFERRLVEKLGKLFPELKILKLYDSSELLTMEAGEHGDHSHGENELDPHIWMAPDLVANQVKWLGSQLSALFPDSASLIHKRAEALRLEFEALHKTLKSMLLPLKGRVIYVFHPAYGYFARSYGLIQKAVEFEGKEPSAGRLAMLIQQAKADKIKVLFVQPQFSIKTAKIIADSLGAAVVPINPLSEDLLENLKQIAQTLLQYLP